MRILLEWHYNLIWIKVGFTRTLQYQLIFPSPKASICFGILDVSTLYT